MDTESFLSICAQNCCKNVSLYVLVEFVVVACDVRICRAVVNFLVEIDENLVTIACK